LTVPDQIRDADLALTLEEIPDQGPGQFIVKVKAV
jgi:hypothetical protein